MSTPYEALQDCPHDVHDITLGELLARYIDYQQKTVKKSTLLRNKTSLCTIVTHLDPGISVNRLTAGHVRDTLLSMSQNPTTVNEYIVRFKAMLRWGYDSDYTDNLSLINKLKKLRPSPTCDTRIRPADKYLDHDELLRLLTYLRHKDEYRYLLTLFLVLSGLRIGEALALEKCDVTDEVIHVTKTWDSLNREITSPKTLSSIRDVFIQPELAEVVNSITAYNSTRETNLHISTPLFFSASDGGHLCYASYARFIREASLKVLGVKRTPHSFRHTHASLLFAEGVSIHTISRRLGHENTTITHNIYLLVTYNLPVMTVKRSTAV